MRNFIKLIAVSFLAVILLAACGSGDKNSNEEKTGSDEKIKVITTFTLLEDIVKQIGGEYVETYNLVPVGTDPHEYEPLPQDIKETEDADVLFFNGLNLEGGDGGWFTKLTESTGQDDAIIYEVSAGVEPMYLSSEDGTEEEINPHSFIDPNIGIIMAENIKNALIEISPENEEAIEENAKAYLTTLEEMDEQYQTRIDEIPEEDRVLVTSERAYQYMADRYDLKEGFIWEVDTEENGTPKQIKTLVNFIKEEEPPVLFVESNVDSRPMETVSNESGVDIYEDKLYSDEIGALGEEADTYVKYLQYNIDKIHAGLTGK
ncbi:MAG TPA: zinc ABC transporter substrate-binding protein [Pseudogracilibacillus sp.]|nr:zinc ABC transporter substrate-binding protein [Pseudogracilibacillus sp.]